MILSSDYHTHTIYSHGKGDIIDNALIAKEKGLKEIGISDHGFSHPAFGLRNYKLSEMVKKCKQASKETGVKVLMGIESNITGLDGQVDLKEKNYKYFDIFLCGVHKFIMFHPTAFISTFLPDTIASFFKKTNVSQGLVKRNTKALINVIKKNPIDAITHLNFCSYTDSLEVAKVAEDYGTYIELNSKKVHLTDDEICNMVTKTNVRFIIDSDAHNPNRVGEISLVEKMLKRVDFPLDRIDNIDGRLPQFRFNKFKEKL